MRFAFPQGLTFSSGLLLVGFTIVVLNNFLPVPHQHTANVFYALCAIPAIVWCITHRAAFASWLQSTWTVWLFTLSIAVAAALKGEWDALKPCMYVFLLGIVALQLSNVNRLAVQTMFVGLAAAAFGVVVWASYTWLNSYLSSAVLQRVTLWGGKHPLNTALLIVFLLVWFWEFKLEPALQSRGKAVYLLALLGFFLLVVWSATPFQARSALLGFLVYLMLKVWLSPYRWYMMAGVVMVTMVVWLTGLQVVFYERGFSYRPEIWMDAWQRLSQVCGMTFGCGHDGHLFAGHWTHAHSAYLMPFYEYGLVVAVPMAIFAFKFFLDGILCHSRWMLVAAVGWGGVLTDTSGVVFSFKPFWIYFWIPTFMALTEYWRRKQADDVISTV